MTRILQLTDLHVFSEPGQLLKGIPTRECLQDVVSHIAKHEPEFQHVIVTGDHTHDERPESYRAVQDILAPLKNGNRTDNSTDVPLWQVPGNHDDRDVLTSVFPRVASCDLPDKVNFHFTTGDWLCVGLDTHLPGSVSGLIEAQQTQWLKDLLTQSSAKKVALFCHHPPVDVHSQWMDAIGLDGRELLHEVVQADDRIRLICCGHVHHEFSTSLFQAQVLTTPSTGIQFDPAGDQPRFTADAPGYRVIEFHGTEYTTHIVRLPETGERGMSIP